MTSPFDATWSVQGFSGRAPLFPLPNVGFLPYVILPLHIFEPRYRAMTADALEGERLIAMALMQPGWEVLRPHDVPAIHQTTCLGRIASCQRLDDGRYYLLLHGMCRARVVAEEESNLPYRVGRLELFEDLYRADPVIDRDRRRRELLEGFRSLYPDINVEKFFGELQEESVPLGALCDIIGYALRLPPEAIQQLLEALDVDHRSELVLEQLRAIKRRKHQAPPHEFPPLFSEN
jgi:Lon protease-like protein